uniref:Zinc finger CCCH domain-containing protein 7A-like n=1 Tax=Echeneis naucrates TaxID=173247 RepID=A0A665SUK6_ECHNA
VSEVIHKLISSFCFLVCNLLNEGNALFREGELEQGVREYSEGLNVSCYASGEDIQIPEALVESLYVNRATAYHSMGEYDQGVKDCDRALEVCKESCRALYRKALCLKELGKYKEAYNCTTDCLLITRLVNESQNLGFTIRAFVNEEKLLSGFSPFQAAFSVPSRTSTCGHTVPPVLPAPTPQLPRAFFSSAVSQLNSLDSLTGGEHATKTAALDSLDDLLTSQSLDTLDDFSGDGGAEGTPNLRPTFGAPNVLDGLDSLDDFLDTTPSAAAEETDKSKTELDMGEKSLDDFCMQDILLCRRKESPSLGWTRVRPIPRTTFTAPFVLCKNLQNNGWCQYGEACTFAYNQLEIDVWTEERKGTLERSLLFETAASKLDPVESIRRLQWEHKGMFIFLCQECYNNKPRIISKRCRDSPTICSNLDARHTFDANKCLAFVVRNHNVNYSKVRPLSLLCQLDLCHQATRYGCQRQDKCYYAHSIIELKTWRVQRLTGISPDEIVKVATKYYDKQEPTSSKQRGNRVRWILITFIERTQWFGSGKVLNKKMKFSCAQCWCDGLISEPDKSLKYCTAKTKHKWTKDRRVLLVKSLERSKWVQVRSLPQTKRPAQYDICPRVLDRKKCSYSANCTFAHSQEEKEMWTYMKNNDLWDMQQIYDMWLTLNGQNHQANGAGVTQPVPEEKCIAMPTDNVEPMSGFHCRLCGRHSNSERQWQQHISSEKHKDRVFSYEGEDEALMWNYRFPGTNFELCPKLDGGCKDGVGCDFAHSPEELKEWTERRDFLRQKLAQAREDMLIMPDELDFGKYNFLLQD